ncbi:hypothetical protein OROMI_033377 [Orobanche minor]
MASWSVTNPGPPRPPSPSPSNLHSDQSWGFGSMNFGDILRKICSNLKSFAPEGGADGGVGDGIRDETAEEVWRDIVSIVYGGGRAETAMTLEDFLTKAGAVDEEDVRVSAAVTPAPLLIGGFVIETKVMSPAAGVPAVQFAPAVCMHDRIMAGGFGVNLTDGMAAGNGVTVRRKRDAAVEQVALDKATQQRQKRMLKNRESAARSWERKQAYTVKLETMVTRLQDDNARLLKEEIRLAIWHDNADMNRERFEQV